MRNPSEMARGSVLSEKMAPRLFYVGMAVVTLLIVFIGFAPTYYLKTYTGGPPLSPLVHLHGLIFSSWMLLFLVQTMLVAAHRTDLHRRLGVVAGALAGVMVVVGVMTAVIAARRGHNPSPLPDSLAFLAIPLIDIVVFSALIIAGLYYRGRKELHKRLMLLATLTVLTAALGRFPVIGNGPGVLIFYALLLLAGPLHDYLVNGRVHRLYVLGSIAMWVSLPLRFLIGVSQPWRDFAGWLIR